MAYGMIPAIVAAAAAAASAGYAISGAGNPTQPNLASSSRQMSEAQAQLLPFLRQLQAAAEEGGSTLRAGFTSTSVTDENRAALEKQIQKQISKLQSHINDAESSIFGTPDPLLSSQAHVGSGGHFDVSGDKDRLKQLQNNLKYLQQGGDTLYMDAKGNYVPQSQAVVDFKGYSQADIEGKITEALAQGQLDLSKKYDAGFIQSALDQEKLADPQSVEGRQLLYDEIQKQIANPPQSPVSKEMAGQVSERVAAGSGLTADEQKLLSQAVAARTGATGGDANADFGRELTTGFAGEQRALANAGAGARWLASGETPEDIAYRAEQQNLGNLGNFIGGRTPQAQFRELSGAQAGPTPVTTGGAPPLATMDPNAGRLGASAAISRYGAQANQANPWMAGLSGVLGALNAAGAAGWKPLGAQSQRPSV